MGHGWKEDGAIDKSREEKSLSSKKGIYNSETEHSVAYVIRLPSQGDEKPASSKHILTGVKL